MQKILIFLLTFLLLITCAKDAFEEETEEPTVFFNIEVSASQGGSIDNSGGSFASGAKFVITATPDSEYVFTGWVKSELLIEVLSKAQLSIRFFVIPPPESWFNHLLRNAL